MTVAVWLGVLPLLAQEGSSVTVNADSTVSFCYCGEARRVSVQSDIRYTREDSSRYNDLTRKIRNGGMSTGDLDTIDKLTHTLKSVKGVLHMDDGYSGRYDRGSYARNRDSMGRYSRNTLADKMRDLMMDAPDDRTRQEIQRMVDKLDA